MDERDFCYWLNGYLEITDFAGLEPIFLSSEQVKKIKKRLELVMEKVRKGQSRTTGPLDLGRPVIKGIWGQEQANLTPARTVVRDRTQANAGSL